MTFPDKLTAASHEYLRRARMENLSPNTLENYGRVLDMFADFCRATAQPDEFVAVVAWKTKLFESGLAPSTIKQYLTDLQIFFSAASHRSYAQEIRFADNPIDKTLMPKIPDRPYEIVLTDEQVMQLYRSDAPPHFQYWPRNRAILMLFLNEKIRCSELINLRLSDLDFRDHILIVRSGKGRKYREVDMSDLTELAVEAYLDSGIRPAYLSDDDLLFGNTSAAEQGNVRAHTGAARWHPFSRNGISNMVERTVKAITGIENCRAHDLRHVGSRVCLNAGQSIEELQGQLGHAQISTTQIYCSRMGSKRARDSARAVLAARDAAANELRKEKTAEQNVIPLFA